MLNLIRVKNYAVIDEVELEFDSGFSVMTGETGAGKSILVDAMGLALGDRADASAVRQGASRAEISVLFECPNDHPALDWLREHGLDDECSCSLRRQISAEGRSRAFVNSQPVTLQDLRTLGALLVDIHGQHAHQSLLSGASQRVLLDSYAELIEFADRTASAFVVWQAAAANLAAQQDSGADRKARLDMLRFQTRELEELALNEGEIGGLHAEHKRLANMDTLVQGLNSALNQIYESDLGSAYSQIAQARQSLESLHEHDPELEQPSAQLNSAEIELNEVATQLIRYRDGLEPDPQRLEFVETRLEKIRSLARRHRIEEIELPETLARLQALSAELDDSEHSLDALAARLKTAIEAYFALAEELSRQRRLKAEQLNENVTAQLTELGLPHGEFRVAFADKPGERADASGIDLIEFEVRLNPGQAFGPLSKVASGGELSRISLALEVVSTSASSIPTYVFDEVDAGVGGGVAEIVGRRLRQIAQQRQVLCVTHLPQVASQGSAHYRVMKLSDGTTSRTSVRRLSDQERVEELSRMLGGIQITERTRAHAEEMIKSASIVLT